MSNRADQGTVKAVYPHNTVNDPAEWTHFAIIRNEDNKIRWLINGVDAPLRPVTFTGELRYDKIGLLWSSDGKTVIDFDELCLFDRVLTADELGALTGQKVPEPPKEVVVEPKLPPPGAVAAPTDFKGLKFYLPCDKIEGASLVEAVSGKAVGNGQKLAPVDGPRGKAARVTAGGPGGKREGFDLSAHVEQLAVGAGKPFTMALWVRTDDWDHLGGRYWDASFSGADETNRFFSFYRYMKGVGFLLQQGKAGGRADPANQLARGTHEMAPTKGWIHIAMTRDEKGTVQMWVDGTVAVTANGPFTAEAKFNNFSLVQITSGAFTADFDEFCVFDRVLTEDEFARLAGKEKGAGRGRAETADRRSEAAGRSAADRAGAAGRGDRGTATGRRSEAAAASAGSRDRRAGGSRSEGAIAVPAVRRGEGRNDARGHKWKVRWQVRGRGTGEGSARQRGSAGVRRRCGDKSARLRRPRGADQRRGGQAVFAGAVVPRRTARTGGEGERHRAAVRRSPGPRVRPGAAVRVRRRGHAPLHGAFDARPPRREARDRRRWASVANPTKWQHFVMMRDEKNVVRWYLNGKLVLQPGKPDPVWNGPLGFDRFFIGDLEQTKVILEVDELCLFDRVLTTDELKKLSEPGK